MKQRETMTDYINEVKTYIEKYKIKDIAGLVQEALDNGTSADDLLNKGMIPAMEEIGEGFKNNTVFMPQMLAAAKTMQKGLDILKPILKGNSDVVRGKVVVGTVFGDVHDIGKNLVAIMCEGTGMVAVDLGMDVSDEKFLNALKENPDVKVVGLSSAMTTTRDSAKTTAERIKSEMPGVFINIGGATMDQQFADEIGADGYTKDSASAAEMMKEFSVRGE